MGQCVKLVTFFSCFLFKIQVKLVFYENPCESYDHPHKALAPPLMVDASTTEKMRVFVN